MLIRTFYVAVSVCCGTNVLPTTNTVRHRRIRDGAALLCMREGQRDHEVIPTLHKGALWRDRFGAMPGYASL